VSSKNPSIKAPRKHLEQPIKGGLKHFAAPWEQKVAKEKHKAAVTIQAQLRAYLIRKRVRRYRDAVSSNTSSWAEIERGVSRVLNYVSPAETRARLGVPKEIKQNPPEGIS